LPSQEVNAKVFCDSTYPDSKPLAVPQFGYGGETFKQSLLGDVFGIMSVAKYSEANRKNPA
jgi:hypothetical protein